jgi:hypothetical protein
MSAATLGSPDFFGFLGFSICSLEISLGWLLSLLAIIASTAEHSFPNPNLIHVECQRIVLLPRRLLQVNRCAQICRYKTSLTMVSAHRAATISYTDLEFFLHKLSEYNMLVIVIIF